MVVDALVSSGDIEFHSTTIHIRIRISQTDLYAFLIILIANKNLISEHTAISSSKSEKTNSTDIEHSSEVHTEHSSEVAYADCMEEEDNTPATTPTEDEYLPFDGTGLTVKEKYLEGGEISMSMNLKEDRDFGRKW